MRAVVMIGTVLLLAACAASPPDTHDFSGAFVGVSGGAGQDTPLAGH